MNSEKSEFIIKVDTTITQYLTTSENKFKISTNDSYNYNYDVVWEKENGNTKRSTTGVTGDYVINTDDGGVYEVKISGKFPHMRYNSRDKDSPKIISIENWGDIEWQSTSSMFYEADNLEEYNAGDTPNLSNVEDMSCMFRNANSFNGNISDWNTNNVQYMVGLFRSAKSFNQDISSWDTSNVIDMSWMFSFAEKFNKDLSNWDTSNVIDMSGMFGSAHSFNGDISSWDTSNVQDMNGMFASAYNFNQDISDWCVEQIDNKPKDFDFDSKFENNSKKQPNW